LIIRFELPTVQMNTHLYNRILIGNQAATQFLNIDTKALDTQANATKQIGKAGKAVVPITRRKLRGLFGASGIIRVWYYVANSIGETVASNPTDLSLATMSETMTETGLETDATVPAKTYAFSNINMIIGGGFLNNREQWSGNAGEVNILGKNWYVGPNGTLTRINSLASGVGGNTYDSHGLQWRKGTHDLLIRTNVVSLGGKPSTRIRRQLIPGETYAFTALVKAASAFTYAGSLFIRLYDDGLSGILIDSFQLTNPTFETTYQKMLLALFQIPTTYDQVDDQFVTWEFSVNPAQEIYTDNWALYRNQVGLPWSPSPEEADKDPAALITLDTGAGGVGSLGGNKNWSDGNEFVIGGVEGGFISV
jgi:hypothetical protein